MTIVHPAQPVNGLNPEDVFYAVDDLGTQTGYGWAGCTIVMVQVLSDRNAE